DVCSSVLVIFLEGVVALSTHVEEFVQAFIRIIVIPKRGVELYPGIEQRFVRQFELTDEILGAVPAVDVVTQHDHEIESNKFAVCFHLLSNLILGAAARPAVSYDRKAHGFRVQRKSQVNLRSGCGQARLLRRRNWWRGLRRRWLVRGGLLGGRRNHPERQVTNNPIKNCPSSHGSELPKMQELHC